MQDFSMDPDIHRMHLAAHHMVRHLTAGMAMITCREALLISIASNLKTAFTTAVRVRRIGRCNFPSPPSSLPVSFPIIITLLSFLLLFLPLPFLPHPTPSPLPTPSPSAMYRLLQRSSRLKLTKQHIRSVTYMINQTSRRLNKAKQTKSTCLRKSFFQRKIGYLRWDSNPQHSAL